MVRVIDLFCGAGGFSTGFAEAGHDVVAGVDFDEDAIATFETNHDARAIQADLTECDSAEFYAEHGIDPEKIGGVIGGPPCQGFSLANTGRHVDDERNNLVFVFADHVEYVQPDVFFMENVSGILSLDDGSVLDRLLGEFRSMGYQTEYELLNAADYGVPQQRERVIVQGRLNGEPVWPDRTHAPREELEVVV